MQGVRLTQNVKALDLRSAETVQGYFGKYLPLPRCPTISIDHSRENLAFCVGNGQENVRAQNSLAGSSDTKRVPKGRNLKRSITQTHTGNLGHLGGDAFAGM